MASQLSYSLSPAAPSAVGHGLEKQPERGNPKTSGRDRFAFSHAAPNHETLPHGTDTDTQPDPRRALLAPVLPGETEGEGGLQKSSNSDTLSQTLPSQLGADSEVPSAASVRRDSGEKRPWEGSGSGRTGRHIPASSGILLSAGQRGRGGSSVRVRGGSQPPPAAAPFPPRFAAGLSPAPRQPLRRPAGAAVPGGCTATGRCWCRWQRGNAARAGCVRRKRGCDRGTPTCTDLG